MPPAKNVTSNTNIINPKKTVKHVQYLKKTHSLQNNIDCLTYIRCTIIISPKTNKRKNSWKEMLRFGCYLSMFHCLKQHESYWPHALLVATFDCHIVFVHLSVSRFSRLQKGGINEDHLSSLLKHEMSKKAC